MGLLGELESKYDFDVVNDFMTHLNVMSMSLEPLIVGLGSHERFAYSLGEITHIFKNLHSATKFLRLEAFEKFLKLCLDIVDATNDEKQADCVASDELIDWLLLAADQIESYKGNLNRDEPYFAIMNPKLIKIPFTLIKK